MENPVHTPSPTSHILAGSGEDTLPGRNRACESCRNMKVRCLPEKSIHTGRCQRCARARRECLFTRPIKKQQRTRTDTRVTRLEEELRNMQALLAPVVVTSQYDLVNCAATSTSNGSDSQTTNYTAELQTSDQYRNFAPQIYQTNHASPRSTSDSPASAANLERSEWTSPQHIAQEDDLIRPNPDVVDRQLLPMTLAKSLFEFFVQQLAQQCPVVTIPEGTTVHEMRNRKPVLFLAVVTAAAGASNPDLYQLLSTETSKLLADRVIVTGEKSLELVQAILISAMWNYPSENFKDLKFSQWIHMAATMALDLGLDKFEIYTLPDDAPRVPDMKKHSSAGGSPRDKTVRIGDKGTDEDFVECCRTLLVCYLLCAGVAISLRRPNFLRFSERMESNAKYLENSSVAQSMDKRLAAWIRLQRVADDFGASLAFDDPTAVVNLADSRTQLLLRTYGNRLQDWMEKSSFGILNDNLILNFYLNRIRLYEIVLHEGDNLDDFKPPFVVDTLCVTGTGKSYCLPGHIDAITLLLDTIHGLLDHILGMSIESLRISPVVNYVGISYSLVILIKVLLVVSDPGSGLGILIDTKDIKVEFYLDQLQRNLSLAWGPGKCTLAGKYLRIVARTMTWYQQQQGFTSSTLNEKRPGVSLPLLDYDQNEYQWLAPPTPDQQQQLDEKRQIDPLNPPFDHQNYVELFPSLPGPDDDFWAGIEGNPGSPTYAHDTFMMDVDPNIRSLFPDLMGS